MQYFTPRFQIATLAPPQTQLQSKIGGLPWGLPAKLWPSCCGHPQKLLAQLVHEPPMLDLGDENAVLHLFQCLECLGIGDDDSSRAAFIVDRSLLSNGLTTIPGYDRKPDLGEPLIGEIFLTGWETSDDGIPASRLADFYNAQTLSAIHDEFPNVQWYDCRPNTKFGGSPRWTGNGPMGFPRRPFEFLFQLNDYLFVDDRTPAPNKAGCRVTSYSQIGDRSEDFVNEEPSSVHVRINAPWGILYERGSNHYYFDYTNLGSDGTAFAFINRTTRPHKVKWFWNR